MNARVVMVAGILLVAGCDEQQRQVIASPGMSATAFNRANLTIGAALRTDDSDWIGVNSPVSLILRFDGHTLEIPTSARGGGVQIASQASYGSSNVPRVTSLSFDIGATYADVRDMVPELRRLCESLAAMAGTPPSAPPSPVELSRALAGQAGDLREVAVCGGESSRFVFRLTVGHYTRAWRDGGDFSKAFARGYVAAPIEVAR